MTLDHSCEIRFYSDEISEKSRFGLHTEMKQPNTTFQLRFWSISVNLEILIKFGNFGQNDLTKGLAFFS